MATPLSLAELPTTRESAPDAVAPLPPALASLPVAVGLAALEWLFDVKGPEAPDCRLAIAWSVA